MADDLIDPVLFFFYKTLPRCGSGDKQIIKRGLNNITNLDPDIYGYIFDTK